MPIKPMQCLKSIVVLGFLLGMSSCHSVPYSSQLSSPQPSGSHDPDIAQNSPSPRDKPRAIAQLDQTCTNPEIGYTIAYPQDWYTNSGEVTNSCRIFDPEPIKLPENSESFAEAIFLRIAPASFDKVINTDKQEPRTSKVLSRQSIQIDGQPAVILENQATGVGLLEEGTQFYRYVIQLSPEKTLIAVTYKTPQHDYERNKKILNQMMQQIQFKS